MGALPQSHRRPPPPARAQVELKPASDVLAGAVARAASQSTVHPLDTLKVRMQACGVGGSAAAAAAASSAPPRAALARLAGLYAGVGGAAAGAGVYIGTYFAFYGAACNCLAATTDLGPGAIAFVAGAAGALGGSVVKVPLAVCIRSVQAGVYPSAPTAAARIVAAAGVGGLYTGYVPTLLEDVPDMAFKFATYESLRAAHAALVGGHKASVAEELAMGAAAGAVAAAATTPLDVVKTNMMCAAAARPSMRAACATALAAGGPRALFAGVGPRALSNGLNSAVFFAFFSSLRSALAVRKARAAAARAERVNAGGPVRVSAARRRVVVA